MHLSDLVVHVVDASASNTEAQMAAVHEVLSEIGAAGVPELVVVNKADRAPEAAKALAHSIEGSVLVSARTGEGIDDLLNVIGDRLRGSDRVIELVVPWSRGDVLAANHREGEELGQRGRIARKSATLQAWSSPDEVEAAPALRCIRGADDLPAAALSSTNSAWPDCQPRCWPAMQHDGGMVDLLHRHAVRIRRCRRR